MAPKILVLKNGLALESMFSQSFTPHAEEILHIPHELDGLIAVETVTQRSETGIGRSW